MPRPCTKLCNLTPVCRQEHHIFDLIHIRRIAAGCMRFFSTCFPVSTGFPCTRSVPKSLIADNSSEEHVFHSGSVPISCCSPSDEVQMDEASIRQKVLCRNAGRYHLSAERFAGCLLRSTRSASGSRILVTLISRIQKILIAIQGMALFANHAIPCFYCRLRLLPLTTRSNIRADYPGTYAG